MKKLVIPESELTNIIQKAVEIAAPFIPYDGIKTKFKIILNTELETITLRYSFSYPVILKKYPTDPEKDEKV